MNLTYKQTKPSVIPVLLHRPRHKIATMSYRPCFIVEARIGLKYTEQLFTGRRI